MLRLILAASCLLAASGTGAVEKLPTFPKKTPYGSARTSLLALGWKPVKLADADECRFDRCDGRPEMYACSGTGAGNCLFTWRRGDALIEISTIYEEPIVNSVRCRAGC
jgi:hypothetical protein